MNSGQLKGHAAMLGANALWGVMAPVIKTVIAGGAVSTLMMTNFRIIGAAALFWLTSAFVKHEHVPAGDLLRLAGAALLGIVFNQGCYVTGVGYTSPGEASIVTTTMPMWVMLLAAVILKEPITWMKAGGIALGACGTITLVFAGRATAIDGSNPVLGDVLVLTAQLSYALYLTFYRNFIRKYSVVTLMKWMFTFAAIAVLPVSADEYLTTPWLALTATETAGIVYVVAGSTFLAYILVMTGQKHLRPTLVGMYNYTQPVVASLVGVCLGLDRFTPMKIAAVVLIFAGVYLVTISRAATNIQQSTYKKSKKS